MAQRHPVFQVTAPANTPKASALEVPTPFDPGIVRRIRVKIPRGHASLTGIQLAVAHQPAIPETPGAFILGDSDNHEFDVSDMPESGAWSAIVYNLDNRAHYWQIVYFVDTLPTRTQRGQSERPPLRTVDIYAHDIGRLS